MYKDKKRIYKNGYVVVEYPEHPKAFDTGTGVIGVYEHVLIAEEFVIDRPIKQGEVVHHLDKNRENNSPENLLVIENPMHSKLHAWMNKNVIDPSPEYFERVSKGCIRCRVCEKPINCDQTYCSQLCSSNDRLKIRNLSKEALEQMVWEKPTLQIAKDFNVSDTAIAKLCKKTRC